MTESGLVDLFKIVEIRRRRTCAPVAEQIRQGVFSGLLEPGQELRSERTMAESYQANRVALLEVLRALEKEGLITIKRESGGGASVANFDSALGTLAESQNKLVKPGSAKISNFSAMRSMLEPETTHLATQRATPEDISAIDAMVIAQEQELDGGELSRKLGMDLNRSVAKAAHNPVMNIVMNAVNQFIREPIFRSRRTKQMGKNVVTYLHNTFNALQNGNAEFVKHLMAEHIMHVQCHIEAYSNE
jgi:GntR family transcriptional repressor for pyruvate dehydrogenase complex